MVALAAWTGLRCCDIVALRLEEIDWRHDEIRLVQAKTSRPLVLPLPALAGNAVAEWILHGRPDCDAPEVFVRLQPPFVRLGNSTGSTLLRRRLARAGIDHVAGDGKSFHALRRTAGTRLIESGAGQPLTAQILGHARMIPPAATSPWPATSSGSAACRWRSSPASRRGCDEHVHQQLRTADRGDARMADLAGTHPARHAQRDGRFDRFCCSRYPAQTVLTRELATAWCKDTATGTWGAYRSRAVREFGKYLQLTERTRSSCRRAESASRSAACRTCSLTGSWPPSSGRPTPSEPRIAAGSVSTSSRSSSG